MRAAADSGLGSTYVVGGGSESRQTQATGRNATLATRSSCDWAAASSDPLVWKNVGMESEITV